MEDMLAWIDSALGITRKPQRRDGGSGEAGALIRRARMQAGLTQQQLADRAGTRQSNISAYEAGARLPSLPTLRRLIAATEIELVLSLGSAIDPPALTERIEERRAELIRIVERLGASAASVESPTDPTAPLRIVVTTGAAVGVAERLEMRVECERIIGARVEIVERAEE